MRRTANPLVEKFCSKYSDKPKRYIARALHAAHKRDFPTIERARNAIRGYLGVNGKRDRERAIRRGVYRPHVATLPKPFVDEWREIEIDCKLALVLCDIHVPYHDLEALQTAIDYGRKLKPDVVLLNGDVLDYYRISRFPKSKNRPTVLDELKQANQLFKYLRSTFPKSRIIYKHGNHDERYEAYVMEHSPELIGVADDAWRGIIGITEYRIEVYCEQEILNVNGLPVLHGHELPKGMASPVNPARGAFLRTVETCLIGHHHQTSSHTARTGFSKKVIAAHSVGCLCQLSPKYARINQWNHGFATVEKSSKGWVVENKKIIDGEVY